MAATLEILTAALPEFVITTLFVELLPTPTDPNATLVGDAVSLPLAVEDPVPASATVNVGFVGSLLTIARLPVTLPAVAGANVSVNVADWPAVIVFGVVMPLNEKSAPVSVNKEIVRSAAPVFDKTKLLVPLLPVETVPKSTEVELSESCGLDVALAEADRSTINGLALPSVPIVSVPVILPAAVGVTATLNFVDCPAPNASGMASPATENCEFDTCAEVTFTEAVPAFDTVTACVDCLPTVTLPKLMLPGMSCNSPLPPEPPEVTSPAQPLSIMRAERMIATARL